MQSSLLGTADAKAGPGLPQSAHHLWRQQALQRPSQRVRSPADHTLHSFIRLRSSAAGWQPRRRQTRAAASGDSDSGALPPLPAAVIEELRKQPIRKPAFYKGLERPIGAFGAEWHPLFALLIFFLGFFNHITFDSFTLFKAFAIFQIVNSAVSILFNDDSFDKISTVVAPAVLAIWVVQPSLDPGNIALSILGTYLCKELKVLPFWPLTLSLFAALYLGIGNEWITTAYVLLNSVGLVKARREDPEFRKTKAPLLAVPVLAVSAFVAWKGILPLWTTSLGLGEVARSTYALVDRLRREDVLRSRDSA